MDEVRFIQFDHSFRLCANTNADIHTDPKNVILHFENVQLKDVLVLDHDDPKPETSFLKG